jgi:D-alanine-D-alanine ligase-like ATP-grasp enzyme
LRCFQWGRTATRQFAELAWSRLASPERALYLQFEPVRGAFFDRYWRGVAAEIGARIEPVGYGFYRLQKQHKSTFVWRGEVMLDDHLTLSIAGNKPLVHRLLQEEGFVTPDFLEYDLFSLHQALAFMDHAPGNYVVKPANGGAGGRGISCKVSTRERLAQASHRAAVFTTNRKLLIEKECPGKNCRLLYLNGEFIDAIQRESPTVTGDGQSSIRELVHQENLRRIATGSVLSPLVIDLDARYTLSDQGLSLAHVPQESETVTVKTTSNQYGKPENTSVKQEIHPSIIEYGRKASRVIQVSFAGVDMMLQDHRVPLAQSGCVINEINTTPGLHHQCLVANPESQTHVGIRILNHIFTDMSLRETTRNA